jgi:uncharacterized protein (TIGR00369 family)
MKHMPVESCESLAAHLATSFPAMNSLPTVVSVAPETVELAWTFTERFLRPGGTVSGPAMMSLADTAAYVTVLASLGITCQAVTSSLTIHFLRRPPAADLIARGRIRHLGRRQVTVSVEIYSQGLDEVVADELVAYTVFTPTPTVVE